VIRSSEPASAEEVAAHYDALDAFYREVWGDHVHHGLWRTGWETRAQAVRAMCDLVGDELDLPAGAAVCDIGCGYGATSRLFARERGWRMTAVTVSPAQHAFATDQRPAAANCVYVCADWLNNELPAHAFEGAFAVESSEHMPDVAAFFQQAHRVLRPDARLVVTAWLAGDAPTRWQRRHLLEPICREGRMPSMWRAEDYERMAREAGFQLLRFQDLTRFARMTWPRLGLTFFWKLLTHASAIRFLFGRHARNRTFTLTALRLCAAYWSGGMRYGAFTFAR
jgi:tocopherol O-methyltransferase